jgi:hypothetical protein
MKSLNATVLLFVCAACALPAFADEQTAKAEKDLTDNFEYQTVTTKEGLTFRVPEDMPIVTRNGITAPIPFDEYMYGKFKLMDSRLRSIETKVVHVEEMLSKMAEKDSPAPAAAPPPSGLLRSGPNASVKKPTETPTGENNE